MVIRVKLFKTLLIIIPCLFISVLVILAIPKEDNYVYDEVGDLAAFDEPTYVTNSDMGFFYKQDQLDIYRKQKRPDKVHNIVMSKNIVTTDFTKEHVSILPDIKDSYTGSKNLVMYNEQVVEYIEKNDTTLTLNGIGEVAVEDTYDIYLSKGILGHSDITPHRIVKGYTYYAAFTKKLESIYFELDTDNEFLSVILGNLSGNVKYTLYDHNMNTVATGLNNAKSSFEIKYKGRGPSKYYLAITGSFNKAIKPFSIALSSDNNEWMWQMVYADAKTQIKGKFDYYGDEDYFVLPKNITSNLDKSVVRFTNASYNINVVIYNSNKEIIGQYVYDSSKKENISMYGLKGAYAMSVYSHSGGNSGNEYAFVLDNIEIKVLDIATYGFKLSPQFSQDTDYYTATVKTLTNKKINDVMFTPRSGKVIIKVTQQCGLVSYSKLGENLNLGPGRNIVEISVTISGVNHTITIAISDTNYNLSYGRMLEKKEGIPKDSWVLVLGNEGNKVRVQICAIKNSKGEVTNRKNVGKTVLVPKSSIYTGLTTTKIPNSYKAKIAALKAKHPKWQFTFVKTGISLEDYAKSKLGAASMIHNTGKQATLDQIIECADPANFLDEQTVFMFEKQIYNGTAYSTAGVKSIWNNSTYASYIMDAAKSTGLSPYFIAARAGLETNNGSSALAMGQVDKYKGYYNFYGINANDSNPLIGGASYAKSQNWNSKRKAIIEGAAWVKTQYVSCQQNTIYFMKYSFTPNYGWHQYMTDIYAPIKDAQNYYKAHKAGGTLNSQIEFIIPVFD